MIVRFRPGVLDNLPLLGLVHLGLSRRHASNRGGGCPSGSDSSSGADHVGGMARAAREAAAQDKESKRSEEPGSCQFAQTRIELNLLLHGLGGTWYGRF